MRNALTTLFAMLMAVAFCAPAQACTTAVISGKFTKSGRPMIWKVRDTDFLPNNMVRVTDCPIEFVGLCNADTATAYQIWGGHNAKGFAIMNSASFNVNEGYTGKWIDREGYVIREALSTCTTLADFEALLNRRPRPMGLAAHFGVIDAQGGAAFYEVNNETWTKFDANDPAVAPRGYVLRTNFSETGTPGKGYGFIRRASAEKLFADIPTKNLTVPMLMQQLSRSLYHNVLEVDYREEARTGHLSPKEFVATDDMICRYGTASCIVTEGIAPHEVPCQTTSWVQIGLPFVSVSLPVVTGRALPTMLMAQGNEHLCPLAQACMKLRAAVYPLHAQSDGHHYLLLSKLDGSANGILPRIEQTEQQIFCLAEKDRAQRPHTLYGKTVLQLQQQIEALVEQLYEALDAPLTQDGHPVKAVSPTDEPSCC